MGMCQKRCPKCKKKRRFVDSARWSNPPINPFKDQSKHDAGWRYIEGERICGYCVWKLHLESIGVKA